jgi:hypothetical protein
MEKDHKVQRSLWAFLIYRPMRNIKRYTEHIRETEDSSYLKESLYVVTLVSDHAQKVFVFRGEADAETKFDELNKENPNIPDSRRFILFDLSANAEIDIPEVIQRAWDDEEEITADDLDLAYTELSRNDREKVDDAALKHAIERGQETAGHKQYYVYYEESTTEEMLEILDSIVDSSKNMDEVLDFFGGDLSWTPPQLGLPEKIRKKLRSRGAFGRF